MTRTGGFRPPVRFGEGPSRLLKAKRAIQAGKLPNPGEDVSDARARLDERADKLRHLVETLDLLYDAFGQRRFGKEWADTLSRMQRWLSREERRAT